MTSATLTAADQTKDIARIFALQQAHQWDVKATNAATRKAKLAKLKAAIEARADEIVAAVLEDTRKPEGEIRVTEVLNILGNIQLNIDSLEEWMTPTEVMPSKNPADKAMISYEARGVCLVLGPWNFPLGLTLGPVAAAVAAGNCCMVKLTDLCPATARVAKKIIADVFDESEVAVFEGDVSVATALLELPFNHIFFTGSTRRRQDRDGGGGQEPRLGHAGAGRQIAGDHRRGREHRGDLGGARRGQAIQRRPGLHLPGLCLRARGPEGRAGRRLPGQCDQEPV